MEEKYFPEVSGGGRYFLGNSERVRELTLSCESGKSGGVGGLQLKFSPWWGSGHTQCRYWCIYLSQIVQW